MNEDFDDGCIGYDDPDLFDDYDDTFYDHLRFANEEFQEWDFYDNSDY